MNHGITAGGEGWKSLKKLIGKDKGKGPGIISSHEVTEHAEGVTD